MDNNQLSRLEQLLDSILDHIFVAWNDYFLLEGLHIQAVTKKQTLQQFKELWMRIYGAGWDGLLVKLAILFDKRKDVHSIIRLLRDAKKYGRGSPELIALVSRLEKGLSELRSRAEKVIKWRHEVIAHRTDSNLSASFYKDNKVSLSEAREVLEKCTALVNEFSLAVFSRQNDLTSSAETGKMQLSEVFDILGNKPIRNN